MPQPTRRIEAYLSLARALAADYRQPDAFLARARELPTYTRDVQEAIWPAVESVWYAQPQLGWALTAVADAAALFTDDPLLQAQAALAQARAANHWFHPQYAKDASRRARLLFEQIQDPLGAAAAEIEHFAFTNTFLDTAEVKQRVSTALDTLAHAPDSYASTHLRGRLALAFALGLLREYAEAEELLASCEEAYRQRGEPYALARICQIRAGQASLRNDHAAMERYIVEGLQLLEPFGRTPFSARLETLAVYKLWVTTADYGAVIIRYRAAQDQFVAMGIDVWVARIDHYIALVRWMQGRINEAAQLNVDAQPKFDALGDAFSALSCLIDLSNIKLFLGDYETAIDYALQGSLIAENNGRWRNYCIAIMNQGWAYFHLGQFQNGLIYLERSLDAARRHNLVEQVIGAEIWLAQYWLALKQSEKFESYLNRAEALARENNQQEFIFEIFEQRVRYWLTHQPPEDFEERIETQIKLFEALEQSYFAVELKRQLGNFLSLRGEIGKGERLLQAAIVTFEEMGRTQKLALSWLNLGDCQQRQGQLKASRSSWKRSLDLSQTEPDTRWQAASRLAQLNMLGANHEEALTLFEEGLDVLASIRQNIWQPTLVDGYTEQAIGVFNAAVQLAYREQDQARLLKFIEAAKAQTLNNRLMQRRTLRHISAGESNDLLAQRQKLEERQRAFKKLNPIQKRRQRKGLMTEIRLFNELLNRVQRQKVGLDNTAQAETATRFFDVQQLRDELQGRWGTNWMALTYYLDDTTLTGVVVTATEVTSWQKERTLDIDQGLENLHAGRRQRLDEKHLARVGEWLFPPDLLAGQHDSVKLLVAPHRLLHNLPYPALRSGGGYLIEQCVLSLTPALSTYSLLAEEPPQTPDRANGIVFAVSEFNGRYPDLPAVRQERGNLVPQLSSDSLIHLEEDASWATLSRLVHDNQFAKRQFFHFASHAEFNPQTPLSPLNGLAFSDKTIALDQLQMLDLNIPLVTLAACSGLSSHQAVGDEHSGIAVSFLQAGARAVVGALWPIEDTAAATLLPQFYTHYIQSGDSAAALARTQRAALVDGMAWEDWGILLQVGHGG